MADLLLSKGYDVYGGFRRSSTPNFWRLRALGIFEKVRLISFDLGDQGSIEALFAVARPDECYNFASQSSVPVSFQQPDYTNDVNAGGVIRMLHAMRRLAPECRFYQASSSEMFGDAPTPQSLSSPFRPRSPYACAKVTAHLACINYRDAYKLHINCGIAFNHESPLRGVEFVTKKITHSLAHMKVSGQGVLELGNIFAKRDWGFAGDYVNAMWRMLQLDAPGDFVICTGESFTVQDFVEAAAEAVGFEIEWAGAGADTVALDMDSGRELVKIDPDLYRPLDMDLLGDPTHATDVLGWRAKTDLKELAGIMAAWDLQEAKAARLVE
jgi:GDPmannose 4,6-dehydratase